MSTFPQMAEVVPEGRIGIASVAHFDVSASESAFSAIRGGYDYVPAGRYARLLVNGQIMMSDTRMERITNYEVVRRARGHVLVAGLGLGMILVPMLRKPDVERVTVIEKHSDVMALVSGAIRSSLSRRDSAKLHVVHADIFDWKPGRKGRQFDVIYFDIWPDVCVDNLADMTKLRRKFAGYLRVGGWAACWRQDDLRARR